MEYELILTKDELKALLSLMSLGIAVYRLAGTADIARLDANDSMESLAGKIKACGELAYGDGPDDGENW